MELYASGQILGVRDRGSWLNRETGEQVAYTTKVVDVYDPQSGPGELLAPVEMDVPEAGTVCTFRVSQRVKSNFAGDTIEQRITEIVPEGKRRLKAAGDGAS